MTEQHDEKKEAFFKRLRQVTVDEFVTFLEAKDVTTICSMCGHDGKQIIDNTDHVTLDDLLKNQEPQSFVTFFHHQPAIPGDSDINYYYKTTCDHCGYITTHSVAHVLKWLELSNSRDEDNGNS